MSDLRTPGAQAAFRRKVFFANKLQDGEGRPYLRCYICQIRINPATTAWHADHVIPHYFDGKEGLPCCLPCHKEKTAKKDIPAIAKSKRVFESHVGIKRKGWNSNFRKKMNGEVVRK